MGDVRNWYQQEFIFEFPKKKKKVDYDLLVKELRKHPLTFSQIETLSGVTHNCVSQVITTLSLHYPLYEVSRGVYKFYSDEDYGDGINREALKDVYDEET